MNITRLNFLESLPLVKSTISKSHFLAFDLEMSGIQTEQLTSPSIIDSMQKRYEKQKQSIDKFIPLQFGLSAFEVLPALNKIIAYPFNFYILPITQPIDAMRFSFHAGTMNFLTKNQFDFNKLFYEGIPYTSREKLKLFEKEENINNFRSQLRRLKQMESPEVKAFLNINLPVAEQWIASDSQTLEINIAFIKHRSYMFLKEKIETKYPNIPLLFQFDGEQFYKRTKMTIRKCTQEEKQGSKAESSSSASEVLFNQVFDEIHKSKKPLIVHNGFIDLLHVYFRFMKSLPESWSDYKTQIHSLFPYVYDNKYLFANSPTLNHQVALKMTGLQNCFVAMRELAKKQQSVSSNSINIEIAQGFKQYNLDSLECHEAGFDSLMTGYSFLKGITHLNSNIGVLTDPVAFHAQHQLIKNRVPLGSIRVPFNLEENDEDIYTKDANTPIFFKSILHQSLQEHTILEYFSRNYGSVNLIWTSRSQTQFCIMFISQQVKNKYLNALKSASNSENTLIGKIQGVEFLIMTHQQHQQMMKNLISLEKAEAEGEE